MMIPRARGAALARVALLLSFLVASLARSTGPASCDARSGHGASDSGDGGYTLVVSNSSLNVSAVAPSTRLELVLTAPGGSVFKGFVMHASNTGTFAVVNALDSQLVDVCHGGNAVGHRSAASKSNVRAYFTAPATNGAVTVTAQAVESRMTVYEVQITVTVVGAIEDEEDEGDDSDDDSSSSTSNLYEFSSALASDATLSWTVGPADATAYFDALRSGEVAFAIETTRSGAASVAVAFQSKESDGAMFPADAVLAWLDFDDAATGFVGSYALRSYDADAGVVGPENEKLDVHTVSVERRRVDDEKTSLIARFVAKTDDVAAALGVADAFVGESETSSSARVAYAIGSVPGKAYHDLGRGSVFVNLHVGGDGERFVSKSATLKRKRFQAHAAVALGAFFSMSLGTLVSGFLKKQLVKDWFKMHVAFQLIGSLLVVAALAIALRESRGETSVAFEWGRADSDVTKRAHGGVGVALVVCVVGQVALGFFREAKGTLLRGREKQKRTQAIDGHEERGGSIRDADVERETYERSYGQTVPPLRKAHVSLGWLLVLGGFANAIVGSVLFERLVYRDTVDVAADGATKTRSAFWYVAWTLFGVVAALFCLRVFSSRKG
jgi:acyl-coenzyme A thioesterase PaaI-like protein